MGKKYFTIIIRLLARLVSLWEFVSQFVKKLGKLELSRLWTSWVELQALKTRACSLSNLYESSQVDSTLDLSVKYIHIYKISRGHKLKWVINKPGLQELSLSRLTSQDFSRVFPEPSSSLSLTYLKYIPIYKVLIMRSYQETFDTYAEYICD